MECGLVEYYIERGGRFQRQKQRERELSDIIFVA
jgi:hypothetical protein